MKKTKITQRRHFKKIAAGALITVMVGTMQVLPVSAKTENRLSSGAGFFAIAATAESGSCGENATWALDDNGRLTISGTGDMYDFVAGHTGPWETYRDKIKTVVIEDGITSIGERAFYCYHSITSVTIPDSVTSIGKMAFTGNEQLTEINIPAGVTKIDNHTFEGCMALKKITFAKGSSSETARSCCLLYIQKPLYRKSAQ